LYGPMKTCRPYSHIGPSIIFSAASTRAAVHTWAHKMNKLSLANELELAHSSLQALLPNSLNGPIKMPAWAYMNKLPLADALELAHK
jgi:hypothetical protein